MSEMSDLEVLKKSYKQPALFGEIFDRYNKTFLKIARKSLRSEAEAEDAVQEAFVRIYKYGAKFVESHGDFKRWSYTILRNSIIDQVHKKGSETVELSEEMESVLGSNEDYLEFESDNYIRSIFVRMSAAGSEILKMRFLLGKSFKEIARILEITSTAARVRVYRAKKEFMDIRNEYGK